MWSGVVCQGLNRRFVMRLAAVLLLGLGLAAAFLSGAEQLANRVANAENTPGAVIRTTVPIASSPTNTSA